MKYNLSQIMHKAWAIYRKGKTTFSEALHRAWQAAKSAPENEQRVTEAKEAAGIIEETHSWYPPYGGLRAGREGQYLHLHEACCLRHHG